MNLRQPAYWILVLFFLLTSCKKDGDGYRSFGVITGPDLRECACCGGYFIEINDSIYQFDQLPPSSGIELQNETFPLGVRVDWSFDRNCAGIQYISIDKIKKH